MHEVKTSKHKQINRERKIRQTRSQSSHTLCSGDVLRGNDILDMQRMFDDPTDLHLQRVRSG